LNGRFAAEQHHHRAGNDRSNAADDAEPQHDRPEIGKAGGRFRHHLGLEAASKPRRIVAKRAPTAADQLARRALFNGQ
jgi:hypothetical protein